MHGQTTMSTAKPTVTTFATGRLSFGPVLLCLVLMALSAMITGCGQKGPLYLPKTMAGVAPLATDSSSDPIFSSPVKNSQKKDTQTCTDDCQKPVQTTIDHND